MGTRPVYVRTIMCGSYTTTRNYKIVILNQTYARANSSSIGKTRRSPRREKSAISDVHLVFFVRYHLDSLPAMPIALASSRGQK